MGGSGGGGGREGGREEGQKGRGGRDERPERGEREGCRSQSDGHGIKDAGRKRSVLRPGVAYTAAGPPQGYPEGATVVTPCSPSPNTTLAMSARGSQPPPARGSDSRLSSATTRGGGGGGQAGRAPLTTGVGERGAEPPATAVMTLHRQRRRKRRCRNDRERAGAKERAKANSTAAVADGGTPVAPDPVPQNGSFKLSNWL